MMSRFQAAVHNFGSHAVSGISSLIACLYAACEASDFWDIRLDLLAVPPLEPPLAEDADLQREVARLREKFLAILEKTTTLTFRQIAAVEITVDFAHDTELVRRRRALFVAQNLCWYGHDPYFEFQLRVALKTGPERVWEYKTRCIQE